MALRSVIEIDVQDSSFQRFAGMFSKYHEALKDAPGVWAKVSESAGIAAKDSAELGSAVGAAAYALHRISAENASISRAATAQSHAWRDMARDAGKFAVRIGEATRSLLRWGALTGLISGILGAGGLFGIDRLAASAGNQRRNALGLGVTPGEAKAFDTNYGRVVDTGAFLSGVNEALHDVTKRVGLYGAGLTEKDLAGKDTAQVGAELLPQLKKIADQTPESMLGNVLTARHLDQFITLQDFQRLRNTPAGELDEYGKHYAEDKRAMDLPTGVAKAWQDLQVQFNRAAGTLTNVIINGLTPLAPQLEHLSAAFTKLVADVLGSQALKTWIDELATGIKWLGDYIGTEAFRKNVISFLDGVETLAVKVVDFVKNVAEIVDAIAGAITSIKNFGLSKGGVNGPIEDDNPNAPGSPAFYAAHPEIKRPDWNPIPAPDSGDRWDYLKPWKWGIHKEAFTQLEGQQGLPSGLLDAVGRTESGGNPNAVSKAGALGAFQFTQGAWQQYGKGGNPFDIDQSAGASARYYHDLLTEFHGDVAKAAAAYNWGPANVEKDVAKYGSQWREHLPDETRDYVGKVTSRLAGGGQPGMVPNSGKPTSVMININNNTGGNATVSASQLAI